MSAARQKHTTTDVTGEKSVFFVIRGSHVIMSVSLCGSDEETLMYKYLQKWSVVDPSFTVKILHYKQKSFLSHF